MAAEHPIRRPGRRLARDVARALGLGALIAVASAAAPAAAGAAGILIQVGGAERHLSPDEITASVDQPAGTYLLRAEGTTAEPVAHPPALSVRRLVQLAGSAPEALSFVSIERPNGTLATLSRADVADPAPFPEGPPLVWIDAGGTRYLRPLRTPDDANAADNIGVTSGDLVIRIRQGPLLAVKAQAERTTVPAGEPVGFSAEVGGATPGAALSYAWTFGDGTGKAGATVRHAFRAPGVYEVVVSVNGADDSGGASVPLRIRVGDPPKRGGAPGGGTGDRRRAPAQGPATPVGNRATKAQTPATPAVTRPRPAGRRPVKPARRAAAAGNRRASLRRAPAGRLVRGTLVAARVPATLPEAAAAQAEAAGRQAAARRGSHARKDPLAPVAGGIALAGLLAAGVRRERRDLRRRREAIT